ncbi:hypothetical protein DWQ65_01390 [Treponema phagedenis]|uniref:Inner membrane protein CreD n=1 Tax=Treponema phagedenis TaxID=162 RepID=A0A0B7GZY7_TREPH|nr:inner membrane CreD family protein [Treponema phagedenis]NVP25040.1 inner membrane CreD family protein [Treponema phagedenis]QEJ94046.1 hypothetical protein FUT79_01655 [Treponema phagedenis]QEJ97155.1 hypothetical protein FUT82_03580 [Treponema phagedenis]QEK01944.1 hypothetical protein FUT84_12755 [Treponema phagedenis]QEK02656.1 hypothetical protein FUT83_01765 [Treponema phagedenis]
MSVKSIFAIGIIFIATSIGWMILGGTNLARTSGSSSKLRKSMRTLYGAELAVKAPKLCTKTENKTAYRSEEKPSFTYTYFYPAQSDVAIDIKLDRRKKGNLWFPTFKAHFSGTYTFKIDSIDTAQQYYLQANFGSADTIYNNVTVRLNEEPLQTLAPLIAQSDIPILLNSNGEFRLSIEYDTSGMETVYYYITPGHEEIIELKGFTCVITTDFADYDFPSTMLSPTTKEQNGKNARLTWNFNSTITGKDIGLIIPNKLNPGDIIPRVSFFAPVSLLFFFVVLLMLSVVYKQKIHPMHFFFLALTFFSFHLMFSYFSDQIDIYLSFFIASVVSLILSVSYVRHFLAKKIAYIILPLIQTIYLIIFSFSFFFDGKTGLIVTICAVITLFILMQITAKEDWDEVFGRK